jgi:hypothetical protein
MSSLLENTSEHKGMAECSATVTNPNGSKTQRIVRFTLTPSGKVRLPRINVSNPNEGTIEVDPDELVSVLAALGL